MFCESCFLSILMCSQGCVCLMASSSVSDSSSSNLARKRGVSEPSGAGDDWGGLLAGAAGSHVLRLAEHQGLLVDVHGLLHLLHPVLNRLHLALAWHSGLVHHHLLSLPLLPHHHVGGVLGAGVDLGGGGGGGGGGGVGGGGGG